METLNQRIFKELKRCPWCGKLPRLVNYNTINPHLTDGKPWFIDCYSSKCVIKPQTNYYRNKIDCINAWNKRTKETTNGN